MQSFELKRPEVVFEYSKVGSVVLFDDSALGNPISIPSNLKPGPNFQQNKRTSWNVTYGLKKFKRYVFPRTESRIGLLLLSIIEYEASSKKEQAALASRFSNLSIESKKKTITILCHNGIFSDITLNTGDEYEVIYYKDQLIFASTNRRENQNKLMSYIGLKFENYLKKDNSTPRNDHYKALLHGSYKEWPFYSVVEVDGIISKCHINASNDDKMKKFAEVKLMKVRGLVHEDEINSLETAEERLLFLKKNVSAFNFKLSKILCQCYFGRQDNIVIGIRNDKFEILLVFNFFIEDLLKFTEKFYPSIYSKFQNHAETISSYFDKVHEFIMSNTSLDNEKEKVFLVKTKKDPVVTKLRSDCAKQVFDITIIPEFVAWRTGKRFEVDKSKNVKDKDHTITQQANEVCV